MGLPQVLSTVVQRLMDVEGVEYYYPNQAFYHTLNRIEDIEWDLVLGVLKLNMITVYYDSVEDRYIVQKVIGY